MFSLGFQLVKTISGMKNNLSRFLDRHFHKDTIKTSKCWFLLQCRDQQPDASFNIFGVQDFNRRVDIP